VGGTAPSIGSVTERVTRAESARQWVLEPLAPPVPVVACVPHGGRDFPADLAGDLIIRPDRLWADWLTRELYEFLPELGITMVSTTLSRFVADVNRDPASGHGGFWSSVVSAQQPNGLPVYRRELTQGEIGQRIGVAHAPFHQALDAVVAGLLRRFPRLLLLDLHSFGRDLPGDVILGDRRGVTARPAAMARLTDALAGAGLDVRVNERFTGGWTVQRFAADDRVDAVQVELNQRRYLNLAAKMPQAPPPRGDFDATQALLRRVLRQVAPTA
jgi:N-formylglutamate deformylase